MKLPGLKYKFEKIVDSFIVPADVKTLKAYGSGHINDTFRLADKFANGNDYLLQRINHSVFKNVPALIQNILVVTNHLKSKLEKIPGANPDIEVLTLIQTKTGSYFHKDDDGNYWRMYFFLQNTHTCDLVRNEQFAFEAGKAFGEFQALLSDLNPELLTETIPYFHDIERRLMQFEAVIEKDEVSRVKEILPEIDFIRKQSPEVLIIPEMIRTGKLQQRIIHYDTKFSNVLLNKQDKAQCVVDLDTVMPGYVASDFGDAIRTLANTAAEDEPDLNNVNVNVPFFEAYAKGYFKAAHLFLTEQEVESLIHGVFLLPFMQAARFLTDYIQGDTYYKTGILKSQPSASKSANSLISSISRKQIYT